MNKKIPIVLTFALGLVVGAARSAAAEQRDHDHAENPAAVSNQTPASNKLWLEAAVADYPLKNCVVSNEELGAGAMGEPINFVYRVDGKPDRLVRFCCQGCIKDFKKDPATYLAIIDSAVEAGKSEKVGGASADH